MLTKLLNIPRHYAQLAALKLILALLILTTLGIFTLFMAAVMVCQWHWQLDIAFVVCLLPWVIGAVVLLIVMSILTRRLQKEKQALIIFKIASLIWIYLLKVKN